MYKSFTRINKSERNVFILWHLFGVARKLILSFIGFHSKNKYYNEKLEMICNNNNGEIEKISVADYIQSYFLFEKKAEFLMTKLKKVPIFKRKNIHFQYNGLNFVREQLLMTLKVAEKAINIIYPASFSYDDENDLEWWIPLIYHHTECTEIIKKGNYQGGGSYQQNFDQIIQKSDELIEWGNNFDYGSNYGGEYNQGDGSYQEHYHGFGGYKGEGAGGQQS
uniref:Uncharacterized protein n=1 Tax=Meloidogyne hapla TaxID=6305 RepID=A0A1I8BW16_MELHA